MRKQNTQGKILHLISSLEVGGAEKMLVALLQEARQSDQLDYVVVVMNNKVNPQLGETLKAIGYPVYFFNREPSHQHPKYLLRLLAIIHEHNVGLIHSHNSGSRLWSLLCKLRHPGLRLVFTFHDTNTAVRYRPFYRWLHRTWINHNIAISDAVKQECLEAGIPNTTKIYNGVNTRLFDGESHRLFQTDRLEIINVARMQHPKKGQDILLHALKRCKKEGIPFRCRLVGGVNRETQSSYEYLQALTKELGLENDVEFITDRSEVADLLKTSDLFILPSRYEGFGLVVIEAMAAGLAVITSDIDGPRELVRHGKNGLLFRSENAEDLFNKISQIYRQQDEARAMAREATGTAKDYDISLMRERYEALYQQLLGR